MYSPSINPNIGSSKAIEVSDHMLCPFILWLMFKGKFISVAMLPPLFVYMLTSKQVKMDHIELTIVKVEKMWGSI